MKQQYLTVSSNLLHMLGRGGFTEREREIAGDAYEAGVAWGKTQQGVQDSEIAAKLLKELACLATVIDWPEGDATKARIDALIKSAKGEVSE